MKTGTIMVKDIPKEIVKELEEVDSAFFTKDGNKETLTAKDIIDSYIPISQNSEWTGLNNPASIKYKKMEKALDHLLSWAYSKCPGSICMIESEVTRTNIIMYTKYGMFNSKLSAIKKLQNKFLENFIFMSEIQGTDILYDNKIDFLTDFGFNTPPPVKLNFKITKDGLNITGEQLVESRKSRKTDIAEYKPLVKTIPLENLKAIKFRDSFEDKCFILSAIYSDSKEPEGIYIASFE